MTTPVEHERPTVADLRAALDAIDRGLDDLDVDELAVAWSDLRALASDVRIVMRSIVNRLVAQWNDWEWHQVPGRPEQLRRRPDTPWTWDDEATLGAVVKHLMENGEVDHPIDVARALAVFARLEWKVTALKAADVDVAPLRSRPDPKDPDTPRVIEYR